MEYYFDEIRKFARESCSRINDYNESESRALRNCCLYLAVLLGSMAITGFVAYKKFSPLFEEKRQIERIDNPPEKAPDSEEDIRVPPRWPSPGDVIV